MISRSRISRSSHRPEQGYILLTLILAVTLLAIVAAVVVPELAFQMKRDREEELIHRGVQYSRAIKHFYKKFNRYPARLEELENTQNFRFLRKRYKDPLTGKDFKLLHMGEVQISFGPGITGATPVNGMVNGPNGMQGGLNPGMNPGASALGGALGSSSPQGLGAFSIRNQSSSDSTQTDTSGQTSGTLGSSGTTGTAAGQDTTGTSGTPGSPGNTNSPGQGPLQGINSSNLSGQVFGGGPILGVASLSKDKSIRVFNKKEHYNQWQFIYDPTSDTGGLLSTPNQPPLQQHAVAPGQPGAPGSPSSGFGNSPFGNSGGMGSQTQPPPQQPPQQPSQPPQ